MTTLWIATLTALAVAVLAFAHSRRTARKLEQVTEMYWQLKLDHGELKARVEPPPAPAPQTTFIPLDRLARPRPNADSGAPGASAAAADEDP